MLSAEHICQSLKLDLSKVLNIYPYGSKVYGTAGPDSDEDFVIVFKGSLLPSGAFKDNAISSDDCKIQGVCYSRSGFIDAINNYQINALECIFLPADKMIKSTMPFAMQKFVLKDMTKKIITTASSSWHFSTMSFKDGDIEYVKKNIYHALRILEFGIQIKEHGRIIDYSASNETRKLIYEVDDEDFEPKGWHATFIDMSEKLKAPIQQLAQ